MMELIFQGPARAIVHNIEGEETLETIIIILLLPLQKLNKKPHVLAFLFPT